MLESLFSKVEDLKIFNFRKKRLQYSFPVNIAKFVRTAFLIGHLWWLLLSDHALTKSAFDEFSLHEVILLTKVRVRVTHLCKQI